jgi:hypothetical protein
MRTSLCARPLGRVRVGLGRRREGFLMAKAVQKQYNESGARSTMLYHVTAAHSVQYVYHCVASHFH